MSPAISAAGSSTNRRQAIRGCGSNQRRRLLHLIAIQQQIEIDGPRSPVLGGRRAAELRFDPFQQGKKRLRRQQRSEQHPHRLRNHSCPGGPPAGSVRCQRTCSQKLHSRSLSQVLQSLLQGLLPTAHVRSQTDQADRHGRDAGFLMRPTDPAIGGQHDSPGNLVVVSGILSKKTGGGPSGPRPRAVDCRSLRSPPPRCSCFLRRLTEPARLPTL